MKTSCQIKAISGVLSCGTVCDDVKDETLVCVRSNKSF